MQELHDILDLAEKFMDMGKSRDALECVTEGLALYPNSPELYGQRALARFQLLEIEPAIEDLHLALSKDPNFHLAYSHLTELYTHKSDFVTAMGFAQKALEIEPDNQFYQGQLAYTFLKLKDYAMAIATCDKILARQENNFDILEYRALALAHTNNYLSAAMDLESIYLADPRRDWLLNDIGYYYSKTDKLGKAKEFLEKAIERRPRGAYPYNNLGFVYLAEKNFKKAHMLIDKSIELDPVNAYAFKNRALVYIAENRIPEAILALERAKVLKYETNYGNEVNELLGQLRK